MAINEKINKTVELVVKHLVDYKTFNPFRDNLQRFDEVRFRDELRVLLTEE